MEDNSLQLIVSLQDEASTELSSMVETMTETLSELSDTFSTVSEESQSSVEGMQSGVSTQLNDMAQDLNSLMDDFSNLSETVQETVLEAGGSFDTMANAIEAATTASAEAMDTFEQNVVSNITEINAVMDTMAENTATQTGSMNASLLPVGAIAGGVFSKISGAVGSSTAAADQWNQETAAVAQTLKDTGSSIPLSQIQAFAVQMQNTTAFTQQQALAAIDVVLKNKDLQSSYQSIVSSAADAAVAQGEASGTLGDIGAAAKLVSDALENPIQGLSRLQQIGIVLTPAQEALAKTLANGSTITTKVGEATALTAQQTATLTDNISKEQTQLAILNEEHAKTVTATTASGNLVANLSAKQNAATVANDKHAAAVANLTEELKKNQAELASGVTGNTKEVSVKTTVDPNVAGASDLIKNALGNISGLAEQTYAAGDGIDHMNQEMNAAKTSLGESFIPLTNKLNELLKPVITAFQEFTTKFPGLSAGIIIAVAALTGLVAVVAILTFTIPLLITGFGVLGAVMVPVVLPILAIIAAVALLAFGIYELIDHWSTVTTFFSAMWADVKKIFTDTIDFIAELVTGIFGMMGINLVTVFEGIKSTISDAWTWIEGIFQTAAKPIEDAWSGLWNGLGTILTDIWEAVKGTIKGAINDIITLVNDVINKINSVIAKGASILHLPAAQIPDIPLLANGGIVNQATLAIIGESGPEAVIPLSQMSSMTSGGQNGAQGQSMVINFNNLSVRNNQDIVELRKMVDKALRPLLVNTKIAHI